MLEIVEYIRDFEQGMTRPALCLAEDGKHYVVKGNDATDAGLIREFIAAYLADEFGLAVPRSEIVQFPDSLCWGDSQLERRFGEKPCFASEYISNVQEFGRVQATEEKYAQFMRDLFVFDFWIKNDDRHFSVEHGGNPNLLTDQVADSLIVIDHNLAFSEDFDLESFRKTHVGRGFWFRDSQRSLFTEQEYKPRLEIAQAGLDQCLESIPPEWLENEETKPSVTESISITLNDIHTEEFWSAIK